MHAVEKTPLAYTRSTPSTRGFAPRQDHPLPLVLEMTGSASSAPGWAGGCRGPGAGPPLRGKPRRKLVRLCSGAGIRQVPASSARGKEAAGWLIQRDQELGARQQRIHELRPMPETCLRCKIGRDDQTGSGREYPAERCCVDGHRADVALRPTPLRQTRCCSALSLAHSLLKLQSLSSQPALSISICLRRREASRWRMPDRWPRVCTGSHDSAAWSGTPPGLSASPCCSNSE